MAHTSLCGATSTQMSPFPAPGREGKAVRVAHSVPFSSYQDAQPPSNISPSSERLCALSLCPVARAGAQGGARTRLGVAGDGRAP